MKPMWNVLKQDTQEEPQYGEGAACHLLGFPIDGWPREQSDEAIQVDSCAPFERIVVTTRKSVYELIVLPGETCNVLVRGGRFFPDFRPARLAGSTGGGSALKLRSLEVGLRMELQVGDKAFLSSPVQTLARE